MPFLKVNDGTADRTPQNNRAGQIVAIALLEVVLIVICFAAITGQAAPNVNESHYLTKAKHFWNPSYCPGDIFLSSSFSHLAFYVTTGWLTLLVSLSTYAWIGRILSWTLIAVGWRRVCRQLFHVPMMSVLAAVFFLILNQRFHLAGEWVIGGFEAKGIAYGFVLLAISFLLQQRWHWVWPLLGAASMYHVLVGGWSTIAAGVCFLCTLAPRPQRDPSSKNQVLENLHQQVVPLLIGFAIALIGILPPLLTDASPELQRRANAIYVSQRISHHLNFASFPVAHISRFTILVFVWWYFSDWIIKATRDTVTCARLKALGIFTVTALGISLAGLVLSGIEEQGGEAATFANQFLRFYLFRLSDFAVPAALALSSGVIIARWVKDRSDFPHQVCAAIFIGCIAVAGIALAQENHADGRPTADARSLPHFPEDKQRTDDVFKNWKRVCDWVAEHTAEDAVFITPAQQQTFKWYAGRTEVCCWKDVPQNPKAMVQWKSRINDLVEPQRTSDLGIFTYSDQQLRFFAEKYGATHLIAMQSESDALANVDQRTQLNQIYPQDPKQKTTWVVYEF
jgi:hypothetical protein